MQPDLQVLQDLAVHRGMRVSNSSRRKTILLFTCMRGERPGSMALTGMTYCNNGRTVHPHYSHKKEISHHIANFSKFPRRLMYRPEKWQMMVKYIPRHCATDDRACFCVFFLESSQNIFIALNHSHRVLNLSVIMMIEPNCKTDTRTM